MGLRIESVRVRPYRLDFEAPYSTALGTIHHRDIVEVELVSSAGTSGIGEATSLSLRGGPTADAIVDELTGGIASACLTGANAPSFEGLATAPAITGCVRQAIDVCRAAGLGNEALCAIDVALFDLAGKLCGEPLWRLLGASRPEPVTCNATLVGGDPGAVAADAAAWAADGFTSFKVKCGLPRDVEVVAAVREAVGPDAAIRVDANGAWDAPTALERLGAMGGAKGIELAEQPCADVVAMGEVRTESGVRIAADESVVDADTAASIARLGLADLATVKLAKVGGISAALEIAERLPVYVSSALDGPVGIAAAAHLIQGLQARGTDAGVAHGLATERLFSNWPGDCAHLEGSLLQVPDGPGHGAGLHEG